MKKKAGFGLLLGVMVLGAIAGMVSGCARQTVAEGAGVYRSEEDGIFSYRVGQFEVFLLVESQREGNAGILLGVDEEVLGRYIPEGGFFHSTNAVFIKTGERNILVDTGTGRQGEPVYEKIKKLGVAPEQVDTVLLTHLHGDHFGGLLKDGEASFPGATVYLSAKEYAFFTAEQPNEGAVAALAPYDIETFEPGELGEALQEILPGIFPVAAYGHTPGHTMFLLESDGASGGASSGTSGVSKLLIWGDLMHLGLVQFPVPEISAVFDMDPDASAVIRRRVMAYAAENKIPVAGMHIVYPGMGYLEVDTSNEGFRFMPID